MKIKGRAFSQQAIITIVVLYILMGSMIFAGPAKAQLVSFNQEELDYIEAAPVLKAVSIDGIAPLSHIDSQGEIVGIGVNILERISAMTGLVFEYELYPNVATALESSYDVYFNAAYIYAPRDMALSHPYLKSETILYMDSSITTLKLDDKKYAAVKGGTLPAGIKAENTIYYDTREAALNAVEKGKADYGYGNAYSLAFYTLQNDYKNIITIPTGKEKREYCLGVPQDSKILLSILNKSIAVLEGDQMYTLILEVASQVERKITLSMIMDAYGWEIMVMVILAIALLSYSVFSNMRTNQRLKIENKRYQLLSHISNECLFEYGVRSGTVELSDKFNRTIDIEGREKEITDILKDVMEPWIDDDSDEHFSTVELPLADGDIGVFKVICSSVYDESQNLYSIIGKLIDISEDIKEKELLINKTRRDGLTGLYNATTTRELVTQSIKKRAGSKIDAFIIIDGDAFKDINDTYGHLEGDQALKSISQSMQKIFRQSDILGRIGGDEFGVYMHDIQEVDFVRNKCRQLIDLIRATNQDFPLAVSIGIAILKKNSTYEELFKQADDALYQAKGMGGAQFSVFTEK